MQMTNDAKMENGLREGFSRLDRLEEALSEKADATRRYGSLGEMIWEAADLLRYCTDREDEDSLVERLKRYSSERSPALAQSSKVLKLPLRFVIERAFRDHVGENSVGSLWVSKYIHRFLESPFNYYPSGRQSERAAARQQLIVESIVTRTLSTTGEESSSLPYLREDVLDTFRKGHKMKPGMLYLYKILLDLGAIQEYPEDYWSRPVAALRNSLSELQKSK